jgi:hypothetical protein
VEMAVPDKFSSSTSSDSSSFKEARRSRTGGKGAEIDVTPRHIDQNCTWGRQDRFLQRLQGLLIHSYLFHRRLMLRKQCIDVEGGRLLPA